VEETERERWQDGNLHTHTHTQRETERERERKEDIENDVRKGDRDREKGR
jgi:hypothetical protein